jgi:PhzF family phenazine biosynthesis protein
MTQPQPDFEGLEEQRDAIIAALGLRTADGITRATIGGITHVLVATAEPLGGLSPDLTRVAEVSRECRAHTLVPMRADDRSTLYARVFGPASGFAEDPGSGSAAGAIGLFARALWGTDDRILVGMGAEIGRPSRIEVDITDEILVGGRVTISAEGNFLI